MNEKGSFGNKTISGYGRVDAECSVYSFTVGGKDAAPSSTVAPSSSQTGQPTVSTTPSGKSGASVINTSGFLMIGLVGIMMSSL